MNRFSQGQLDKTLDLLRQAQELFAQKKHLMTEAQREKVLQQIQEAKQKVEGWHREIQAKEKAGKQAIEDAKRALVVMGEKKAIVDQLVSKVVEEHGYLPVEELIKEALHTRISSWRIPMNDLRKVSDELLRTAALKKSAEDGEREWTQDDANEAIQPYIEKLREDAIKLGIKYAKRIVGKTKVSRSNIEVFWNALEELQREEGSSHTDPIAAPILTEALNYLS